MIKFINQPMAKGMNTMGQSGVPEYSQELALLCNTVRDLVEQKKYRACESLLTNAMMQYPHAPEPHNLIGILLEVEGDYSAAMKHFRAAWALEPTYIPARYNLERLGSFYSNRLYAFNETDCLKEPRGEKK